MHVGKWSLAIISKVWRRFVIAAIPAALIMTFHLLGRYLENRAKGRASQAIRKLLTLGAKTARIERNGKEEEVSIKELTPGDVMIVRPDEKIPTNGEVIQGDSHVDESIATSESLPVAKYAGAQVLGATINKEGRLKVKATRVGADTFLSQVIKLVEEAQNSRVPIQDFADRVTHRFGPHVAMVGDGINDAPALKQADVGIAIGGGCKLLRLHAMAPRNRWLMNYSKLNKLRKLQCRKNSRKH